MKTASVIALTVAISASIPVLAVPVPRSQTVVFARGLDASLEARHSTAPAVDTLAYSPQENEHEFDERGLGSLFSDFKTGAKIANDASGSGSGSQSPSSSSFLSDLFRRDDGAEFLQEYGRELNAREPKARQESGHEFGERGLGSLFSDFKTGAKIANDASGSGSGSQSPSSSSFLSDLFRRDDGADFLQEYGRELNAREPKGLLGSFAKGAEAVGLALPAQPSPDGLLAQYLRRDNATMHHAHPGNHTHHWDHPSMHEHKHPAGDKAAMKHDFKSNSTAKRSASHARRELDTVLEARDVLELYARQEIAHYLREYADDVVARSLDELD